MRDAIAQTRPIGRFLDSMNATEFELGPYERMQLSHQFGTVGLAYCTAPKVHLKCGSNFMCLSHGGVIPVNGHQNFIHNPYGVTVRGKMLFDLPVSLTLTDNPNAMKYAEAQSWYLTKEIDRLTTHKIGFAFMAKRGLHRVLVGGSASMKVFILPNANADFVQDMPAGIMELTGEPIYSSGQPADNIVSRMGYYTDADIATWIGATGWGDQPRLIASGDASIGLYTDEKTGVFVSYDENVTTRFAVQSYDVGEVI